MNQHMKIALAGMILFLLSACGQVGETSAPEPTVISEPTQEIPTLASPLDVPAGGFDRYIGLQYPPFPVDLRQDFSMIIQDSDEYSLSLVSEGDNKMLWLNKLTHRDANGNANWEVMDVLDLSDVETGLTLIPDGCLLNGVPDSEVIVAAKNGVSVWAWRANTILNMFEVIPTVGIECHSDKGVILE